MEFSLPVPPPVPIESVIAASLLPLVLLFQSLLASPFLGATGQH